MKFALILLSVLSGATFAADKQVLDVKALNSPVKEHFAKFQFTLPNGLRPSAVWYQFKSPQANGSATVVKIDDAEHQIDFVTNASGYEVDIPASALPPGQFTVALRVKLATGLLAAAKQLLSHGQPDQLSNSISFAIDLSLEVADPGAAGKQTLAGIDSDNDGIRDDVQRWINEQYNGMPNNLAGAKQLAKDAQSEMNANANKEKSIAATLQYLESTDCLEYILGSLAAENSFRKQLDAKMKNTNTRLEAASLVDENFKGQGRVIDPKKDLKSSCRFNVDSR